MIPKEYFDNLDIFQSRGRGISVFNCDTRDCDVFITSLKGRKCSVLELRLSNVIQSAIEKAPSSVDHCVLLVDVPMCELGKAIERVVNRIVFPLIAQGKPVSLFSHHDRSVFSPSIESGLLHSKLDQVVNLLLIEQLIQLATQNNFQFAGPSFMSESLHKMLFTPIEEKLKDRMIAENIPFTPQVKIGRFFVDFIVECNDRKIIVECDGREFHCPHRDKARDLEIQRLLENVPIVHLTGSEIWNDAGACIKKILHAAKATPASEYEIDLDLRRDASQEEAIKHIAGPARVLAPAGSGKTKTLINRIVNLINHGIAPEMILALAFNKKAEEEMTGRLIGKGIPVAKRMDREGVVIRTFHSFGYEIIRKNLHWTFTGEGHKEKARQLLDEAVKRHYSIPRLRNKDSLDSFLDALRKTKMELPNLDEVNVEIEYDKSVSFKPCFDEYLNLQTKHAFLTFDDMVYLAVRILLDDNVLREQLQHRFRYVLVDEFQDLNKAQILLMQILALPQNNLFIVGDDDQMIYGWRGAEVQHLLRFPERYVSSKDFTLRTNYRSGNRIVTHSKWLIDHNRERVKKNIFPKQDAEAGAVDVQLSDSLWEQGIAAVNWMKQTRKIEQCRWNDFAVLYRYHEFQFIIALLLDKEKISHSPVNGEKLFRKKVGRDIYSYLTVLLRTQEATPEDFKRILKRPNKYFRNENIDGIKSWNGLLGLPESISDSRGKANARKFVEKVEMLRDQLSAQMNKPSVLVSTVATEFGLHEFYKDQARMSTDVAEASDNTLLSVIIEASKYFGDFDDFHAYMKNSLFGDRDSDGFEEKEARSNEVLLSTIHAAKGKEFQNVVYFNLAEDGKLTHSADIEEERRVAYVSVTRAIKNVFITAPSKGYSRFLPEFLLNPCYSNLSVKELNAMLGKCERKGTDLTYRRNMTEAKKKDILDRFPEISNGEVMRNSSFWKRIYWRFREKQVNNALFRINEFEARLTGLCNQIESCDRERMEVLSEIGFRTLLRK